MSAANHNFSIEQGTSHTINITYRDLDRNLINITDWCARLIIKTVYKDVAKKSLSSTLIYSTTNTDYSQYKFFINGSEGRITLLLPADTTNTYDFDTAKYDLELQSPDDFYTNGDNYTIRILYGTITIVHRNSKSILGLDCQDFVEPTILLSSAPDGYYTPGDNVDVSVNYNGDVQVNTSGGTPYINLNIGGAPQPADYYGSNQYTAGLINTSLIFRYIVESGVSDNNGISISQPSIQLNGATIKNNGKDVITSFTSVPTNPNTVIYTGLRPTISTIGTLSGIYTGQPFEITFELLASKSNARNYNAFLIQSINNGSVSKWNGSSWLPISSGNTTVASGEKIRWISSIDASGIVNSFSVRAMNGIFGDKKIISQIDVPVLALPFNFYENSDYITSDSGDNSIDSDSGSNSNSNNINSCPPYYILEAECIAYDINNYQVDACTGVDGAGEYLFIDSDGMPYAPGCPRGCHCRKTYFTNNNNGCTYCQCEIIYCDSDEDSDSSSSNNISSDSGSSSSFSSVSSSNNSASNISSDSGNSSVISSNDSGSSHISSDSGDSSSSDSGNYRSNSSSASSSNSDNGNGGDDGITSDSGLGGSSSNNISSDSGNSNGISSSSGSSSSISSGSSNSSSHDSGSSSISSSNISSDNSSSSDSNIESSDCAFPIHVRQADCFLYTETSPFIWELVLDEYGEPFDRCDRSISQNGMCPDRCFLSIDEQLSVYNEICWCEKSFYTDVDPRCVYCNCVLHTSQLSDSDSGGSGGSGGENSSSGITSDSTNIFSGSDFISDDSGNSSSQECCQYTGTTGVFGLVWVFTSSCPDCNAFTCPQSDQVLPPPSYIGETTTRPCGG